MTSRVIVADLAWLHLIIFAFFFKFFLLLLIIYKFHPNSIYYPKITSVYTG